MDPRDQFDRTVCGCDDCRRLCYTCPGYLIPGDVARIAAHLGEPIIPTEYFRASPGALLARQTPDGVELFRVPTIVPATVNARCVFLQPDGLCAIHPVAPYGCAYTDWHMPKAEGNRRSLTGLRAIVADREYQQLWRALWDFGFRSQPPEQKRLAQAGLCDDELTTRPRALCGGQGTGPIESPRW